MRLLLAILAVLGLLVTPVAASAGAAACRHHGDGGMSAVDAAPRPHTVHAPDHSCCDEGGAPAEHDSKSCAQACAAMCVASAALAADGPSAPTPVGRLFVEAMPLKALHAHAPPGLKRPPRSIA